jgi:anaerobic ribonucleoside-triphosphate reductase
MGDRKEENICSKKTEVYSRVVGFYRPVEQWNNGKREEFSDRTAYEVSVKE